MFGKVKKYEFSYCSKNELLIVFFALTCIIFIFNSLTVFLFKEYYGDDILWYSRVINNSFVPTKRNLLYLQFEWPMWNLMVFSPKFTHLFYILIYMTPLSFLFFYIYKKYLGLNVVISFFAAVLPNVSAGFILIPAYTNGSYITYHLLIGITAVLLGLRSVEKSNNYYMFLSVLLFVLLSFLTEFTVFLCVPYVLLFIFCFGFEKRVLGLVAIYSVVVLCKLYRVFKVGSNATELQNLNLDTIIYRFKTGFLWLLPSDFGIVIAQFSLLFFGCVFLTIVLVALLYFQKKDEFFFSIDNYARRVSGDKYIFVLFFLIVVWLASVSFFTLFSVWFTPRYYYMAAFPFSLLLSIIIYPLITNIFRFNNNFVMIFFGIIIALTGLNKCYKYYNSQSVLIKWGEVYSKELTRYDFPYNSQLYIIDEKRHHRGVWFYNSSYIQFHSKRADLSGHIGDGEVNYFNPFEELRIWGEDALLKGLKLSPPLFMFKVDRNTNQFIPYNYFLKWDHASKESTWSVYDLNQRDGTFKLVLSGNGWDRYVDVLYKLGLGDRSSDLIAFGGCPSSEAVKRLQLTPEEVGMLAGCN